MSLSSGTSKSLNLCAPSMWSEQGAIVSAIDSPYTLKLKLNFVIDIPLTDGKDITPLIRAKTEAMRKQFREDFIATCRAIEADHSSTEPLNRA